jgi:hypothetical protein
VTFEEPQIELLVGIHLPHFGLQSLHGKPPYRVLEQSLVGSECTDWRVLLQAQPQRRPRRGPTTYAEAHDGWKRTARELRGRKIRRVTFWIEGMARSQELGSMARVTRTRGLPGPAFSLIFSLVHNILSSAPLILTVSGAFGRASRLRTNARSVHLVLGSSVRT